MSVSPADLASRVRSSGEDALEVSRCLSLAQQLVDDYVSNQSADPGAPFSPPPEVLDEAVLRTAVDLWNRTLAPNGVLMSAVDDTGDGSTAVLRTPADPLYSARMILDPYVPPLGFA